MNSPVCTVPLLAGSNGQRQGSPGGRARQAGALRALIAAESPELVATASVAWMHSTQEIEPRTTLNLRKRLDAIEKRSRSRQLPVFINQHPEQPDDGRPSRKTGETIAECQERYHDRSRKQIFVFLDLAGVG